MCDKHETQDLSRRNFIKTSSALGAGLLLGGFAAPSFAASSEQLANGNIKSRGYAAFDNSGLLKPWEFERRPVGDNDILIEIKLICC